MKRRAGHVPVIVATLVLSLCLSLSTAHAGGRPRPQEHTRDLAVASFNIHHGAGPDDRLDLDHVARVIETSGADVVGLQEVDRHWSERSQFVDQAAWLADRLDMHVAYGANLDREPVESGQPRRQYGTAVLSHHPVLDSRNILLPRPGGGEQRGLLETTIAVRGVPLRFLTTHLQHDSAEARMAQAKAINRVVAETDRPTVLTGDLNAEPGTPEMAELTTNLDDTWPTAGSGPGLTYDAESPHARIDYVLASAEVVARSARVVDTDASDHRPVVVEVTVTARPGGRAG